MKKFLFLCILFGSQLFAQTKPKILFRSGFENNSQIQMFPNPEGFIPPSFTKLTGVDNSYLPPNDWYNNLNAASLYGGMMVGYQEGDTSLRLAEIAPDPDPNHPSNSVMHFKINQVDPTIAYNAGRVQAGIFTDQYSPTEISYSFRIFLPETLENLAAETYSLNDNNEWFMINEIWTNPDWVEDPYPFRVSIKLKKKPFGTNNDGRLHFHISATERRHNDNAICDNIYKVVKLPANCGTTLNPTPCVQCMEGFWEMWSVLDSTPVELGQWMTIQIHFKQGPAPGQTVQNPGEFHMSVTPDGGQTRELFDDAINVSPKRLTQHSPTVTPGDPAYVPNGIYVFQPMKLYVGGRDVVDDINAGAGQLEAYYDDFIYCDKPDVDLQIRDTAEDLGEEPNTASQYLWASNDIWVRNLNDGGTEHQNPMYNPIEPSYISVRVNNKSCKASKAGGKVHLYWAKAGTALTWPESWDGTLLNQGVTMGNYIGAIDIPPLAAGKDIVLTRSFPLPNPVLYQDISTDPWHFCLLARIEYEEDPISYPENGLSVVDNTRNNNNIAWKNISIVPIITDVDAPVGASVSVRNPENETKKYDLLLLADKNEEGNLIFDEAEVMVTLDEKLLQAWNNGDKKLTNLKKTNYPNKFIITGDNARLGGLKMEANEMGMLNLSFNFLTEKLSDKSKFAYHVIQKDEDGSKNITIGGETYIITRDPKALFYADAGGDKEIGKNQVTTISAGQINNLITYNWYDMEGNLIYVGKDLTVTADVTKKYKLEVIDIDGYKDYDTIEVKVSPFKFDSILPNPASNQITVNYEATGVISAYLMVVNINSGISYNYILDNTENEKIIDISSYQNGLYKMILICDGEVVDNNTLVKE